MQYKKLWIAMGLVMLISFTVLGSIGYKAINNAPPIPSKVVTADGRVLFTGETIRDGQNVWQSTGGRKSAPSGVTARTSRPTGAPTIFTASR